MGARSRRKGATWERELARIFRDAMPGCDARRGIGQMRSASEVADVEVPGFWVEAKHQKRPNIGAALRQAVEARGARPVWAVAVTKADREDPIVSMTLEDFLDLVGEWWGRR